MYGRRQRLKRSAHASPWPAQRRQSGRKYRMVDRHREEDLTSCSLDSPQCARTSYQRSTRNTKTTVLSRCGGHTARHAREPISNQAGTRPARSGEEVRSATSFDRGRPTRVGSTPTTQGSSASRSALAKIRHTRDPRDCLVSFGIVVGAGLPRPPRLVCQTHHEEDAIESPNIVWTSFYGTPDRFPPMSGWYGTDIPARNSTFKRAWISRLMYQKSLRRSIGRRRGRTRTGKITGSCSSTRSRDRSAKICLREPCRHRIINRGQTTSHGKGKRA